MAQIIQDINHGQYLFQCLITVPGDVIAAPPSTLNDAECLHNTDSLPYRGTADIQLLRNLSFRRETVIHPQFSRKVIGLYMLNYLFSKAFGFDD